MTREEKHEEQLGSMAHGKDAVLENARYRIRELEAENARLSSACQNVVTALPSPASCDPAFWPVREQCREAVERMKQ